MPIRSTLSAIENRCSLPDTLLRPPEAAQRTEDHSDVAVCCLNPPPAAMCLLRHHRFPHAPR